MLIVNLLSFVALLASVSWLILRPGVEPIVAVATSLSTLLAGFAVKNKRHRATQNQDISGSGVGIQAGGNVTITSAKQSDDKD